MRASLDAARAQLIERNAALATTDAALEAAHAAKAKAEARAALLDAAPEDGDLETALLAAADVPSLDELPAAAAGVARAMREAEAEEASLRAKIVERRAETAALRRKRDSVLAQVTHHRRFLPREPLPVVAGRLREETRRRQHQERELAGVREQLAAIAERVARLQMRAGLPLSRELTNAMGKAEAVAAQIAGRAKELADVVGRTPEAEAQRSPSPRREASASFNT